LLCFKPCFRHVSGRHKAHGGMAILNLRNILSLAAGVSASAVAVRNALGKEVDKRTDKMIARAVEEDKGKKKKAIKSNRISKKCN